MKEYILNNMDTIIALLTMLLTFVLGYFSKKSTFIDNKMIPIQNLAIGLIVAIIYFVCTKDFNIAIVSAGLISGGSYDIFNNIKKLINKNTKDAE